MNLKQYVGEADSRNRATWNIRIHCDKLINSAQLPCCNLMLIGRLLELERNCVDGQTQTSSLYAQSLQFPLKLISGVVMYINDGVTSSLDIHAKLKYDISYAYHTVLSCCNSYKS